MRTRAAQVFDPEGVGDVALFQRIRFTARGARGAGMRLSIIIPTLNEARELPTAVAQARRQAVLAPPYEIIVADCGSKDGTADLATHLGTHLVQKRPPLSSRAAALNQGAAEARGDVFLFLDADTLVPRGYDRTIRQALADPRVVGGAFEFALDGTGPALRLVELLNRVRYRIWPLYYGDQGLFVRASVFGLIGGYREQRLLEASEFCKRVRRQGKLVLLRKYMKTSARRFVEGGIYRVLAKDAWIWWLDLLGRPTEQFGQAYQKDNRRRGLLIPTPTGIHTAERNRWHGRHPGDRSRMVVIPGSSPYNPKH